MNARAGGMWSCVSTPRNWTLLPYCWKAVAKRGASWMQGPHQDAHTFTRTGFPLSDDRSCWNCGQVKVGSAVGVAGRTMGDGLTAGEGLPEQAGASNAMLAIAIRRGRVRRWLFVTRLLSGTNRMNA